MQYFGAQKKWSCLLLVLCLFFLMGGNSRGIAASPEPIDQVKASVEEVLSILKSEQLASPEQRPQRKQRIAATLEHRFDFTEMSKRTLTTAWKDRTADERDRFVKLFSQLLEDTYIGKIEMYTNEQILFKKQDLEGDKAVVHTAVLKNNIEIPIVYRLMRAGEQWLVYDVVIEGVSLVSNYRTQFSSILDKEKYEGLLARLEKKVTEGQGK